MYLGTSWHLYNRNSYVYCDFFCSRNLWSSHSRCVYICNSYRLILIGGKISAVHSGTVNIYLWYIISWHFGTINLKPFDELKMSDHCFQIKNIPLLQLILLFVVVVFLVFLHSICEIILFSTHYCTSSYNCSSTSITKNFL